MALTLGIYIHCHGSIEEEYLPSPTGVRINKQNLGGYGCSSYSVRDISTIESVALDLQTELVGCSSQQYKKMKDGLIDTYGDAIDTEYSCEVFRGFKTWIKKRYVMDETRKHILFAFQDKVINIVDCEKEELEAFLGKDKRIDIFFGKRTRISTNDLFMLIQLFHERCGVNVVNILDESCNVVFSREKTTKLHRGKEKTGYYPVPKKDVPSRKGMSGYGRTKKNHSKISRIR